jgi:hypothetical protein
MVVDYYFLVHIVVLRTCVFSSVLAQAPAATDPFHLFPSAVMFHRCHLALLRSVYCAQTPLMGFSAASQRENPTSAMAAMAMDIASPTLDVSACAAEAAASFLVISQPLSAGELRTPVRRASHRSQEIATERKPSFETPESPPTVSPPATCSLDIQCIPSFFLLRRFSSFLPLFLLVRPSIVLHLLSATPGSGLHSSLLAMMPQLLLVLARLVSGEGCFHIALTICLWNMPMTTFLVTAVCTTVV